MVTTYQWAPGRGRSVAAPVVGDIIERVQQENGGSCSAAALVDTARLESSPIHDLFEWDDSEAAESYRRDQARGIIRNIKIVVIPDAKPQPAFISVNLAAPAAATESVANTAAASPTADRTKTPVRGYVQTAVVANDIDLRAQALADCVKQLRGIQRRYEWLSELKNLWVALDEIEGPEEEAA